MKYGCKFLNLTPPKNIHEAIHTLLIFYKHVPSITTMPVYIGNIDYLLNPFIDENNLEEAKLAIKLFLNHIDRTITDSFCHANIGPLETTAGNIILELEEELENSTPNITLKYDKKTSKDFTKKAIKTALKTAKPSFANNNMFRSDFNGDYAIASCYNGLPIGGGAFTLVRMNLKKLAQNTNNKETFMNEDLPFALLQMGNYINERTKFLVENTAFFESNFLVKENFIKKENFTSMFGLVGLAECVDILMKKEGEKGSFGINENFDNLGEEIIKKMYEFTQKFESPYCLISNKRTLLHAQVGIGDDINTSPGCRIAIGKEIELWKHLKHSSRFHKYFPSGIGDIFSFEKNSINNPDFILNIIEGSFKEGMRYFSLYSSDADVIRITGYLVKRSDIENLSKGNAVLHDTVVLGKGQVENGKILERKVR